MAEVYDDDGEEFESIPGLENINLWLQENGKGVLDNLNEHVSSGGKAMQARVYGGAFNFLKVDEFIEVVKAQSWRELENVQLLIQDEQEERFTIYTLSARSLET
ncbi:MAG: hypothetical protein V7K53_27235 [Nostoc sp.]|uniref:hypothetical protein n=1 Tax=Nostoc sp. TaxID=1180 RepID=UPI002FF45CA1